jgi:hypothetical protein
VRGVTSSSAARTFGPSVLSFHGTSCPVFATSSSSTLASSVFQWLPAAATFPTELTDQSVAIRMAVPSSGRLRVPPAAMRVK